MLKEVYACICLWNSYKRIRVGKWVKREFWLILPESTDKKKSPNKGCEKSNFFLYGLQCWRTQNCQKSILVYAQKKMSIKGELSKKVVSFRKGCEKSAFFLYGLQCSRTQKCDNFVLLELWVLLNFYYMREQKFAISKVLTLYLYIGYREWIKSMFQV